MLIQTLNVQCFLRGNPSCKGRINAAWCRFSTHFEDFRVSSINRRPMIVVAVPKALLKSRCLEGSFEFCDLSMAQQKIFKSRLLAKDFIKFSEKTNNNNHVSGSPRWQYYGAGTGSQRIVVSDRKSIDDHFRDRKHVTRVSVNNYPCYQSRSLSDLRILLPDVTSTRVSQNITNSPL